MRKRINHKMTIIVDRTLLDKGKGVQIFSVAPLRKEKPQKKQELAETEINFLPNRREKRHEK